MRYALLHIRHGSSRIEIPTGPFRSSEWNYHPNIGARILAVGDDKAALEKQAEQEAEKGLEAAIAEDKELYEEVEQAVPFNPDGYEVRLFSRDKGWEIPHLNYSNEEPSFASFVVVELPNSGG